MAEDVEWFIRHQHLHQPLLIGHSMGAKVAMTLALRQPDKYSGLVPVDNAPVDAALKSDFTIYVQAMKEVEDQLGNKIQKQSDADQILAKYEPDMSIRQFLLTNLVRSRHGDAPRYHWRIPLSTLAKSLPDLADFPFKDPEQHRYKGPTLVVRGTRSHYVADETLPVIGQFFPQFELLDLDSGHWVMSEKFDEFRAGLVDWVGRSVDRDRR